MRKKIMPPAKIDKDTAWIAAEMFHLGLSFKEIGGILRINGEKLRSPARRLYPELACSGSGRTHSFSRSQAVVNVKARLETIALEIENAGEHQNTVIQLKRALEKWMREEESKPPKTVRAYQPHSARQAVVFRLRSFGISPKVISRLTGYPHPTVLKDIRLGGADRFSGVSTNPDDVFRAVLFEYAENRRCQGVVDGLIGDTQGYLDLLRRYLKVSEIKAFLLGVEETLRTSERFVSTPEQEPYIRLWLALAPSDFRPAPQLRSERVVEAAWDSFLDSVLKNNGPIPKDARGVGTAIADKMNEGRRENTWPVWQDDWSQALDEAMKTLKGRKEDVLRSFFGFGQSPQSERSIGEAIDRTVALVDQTKKNALRDLRRTQEFAVLRRQILSAKVLRETLERLSTELAEARAEIKRLRAEVLPEKPALSPEAVKNLLERVEVLDPDIRSANCLQNAGIEFVYQLAEKTEKEMLKTKGLGRGSLDKIKMGLVELGLSFGMNLREIAGEYPWNR